MAANVAPIFSRAPKASWGVLTAANVAKDGTGGATTLYTASIEGAFIQKLIIRPRGTNVASVLRVFMNNGLTQATATNNILIAEVGLIATTLTEVAAIAGQDLILNLPLPSAYTLIATLGTAVAGGYAVTAIGGDY